MTPEQIKADREYLEQCRPTSVNTTAAKVIHRWSAALDELEIKQAEVEVLEGKVKRAEELLGEEFGPTPGSIMDG